MPNKITKEISDEIIKLHAKGHYNSKIAEILGIHACTVSVELKSKGLCSNFDKKQPIDMVDESNARCSKCNQIKDLSNFLVNRRGQKYEYRFTYCLDCRKKQTYLNLNSSPEKYLKNRFNILKRKTRNYNIENNLTFEYFYNLYKQYDGKCFYSGEIMDVSVGNKLQSHQFSIDRLIFDKGYVIGNVVFCTNRMNTIKSNLTLEEIKEWMPGWYAKIVDFQKQYSQ